MDWQKERAKKKNWWKEFDVVTLEVWLGWVQWGKVSFSGFGQRHCLNTFLLLESSTEYHWVQYSLRI